MLSFSLASAAFNPNKGWHPLEQIVRTNNPTVSVDATGNGAVDTADACNADAVCEVNQQIDISGSYSLVQAISNNLELKTSGGQDIILNPGGGKVGIGTASPAQKLDVVGQIHASGDICTDAGGGKCLGTVSGVDTRCDTPGTCSQVCIGSNCRNSWPLGAGGITGSGTANYLSKWTGGTSLGNSIIYDNGNNVGIGTTNPLVGLHLKGDENGFIIIQAASGATNPNHGNPGILFLDESDRTHGGLGVALNAQVPDNEHWSVDARDGDVVLRSGNGIVFGTSPSGPIPMNPLPLVYENYPARMYITNAGNVGIGTTNPTQKLYVVGNIRKTGTVSFVEDYPGDPAKQIVYVSLEGPEAGTYIRGQGQLINGEAEIQLPEHFSLVTEPNSGLTAQVTPLDESNGLKVVYLSNSAFKVKELNNGQSNARFYYFVNGIRKGYENFNPIQAKK
ncbi:MAG: hypothetical protein NTY20_00425 [Candidatus Aenigmarchaeota archaeon]|nr:hypothetical protein [Candidatus Aenigmarchaeota archaeon]